MTEPINIFKAHNKGRIGPDRGRSNFIRKIDGSENVLSRLLDQALCLHYTCVVWQRISAHKTSDTRQPRPGPLISPKIHFLFA